MTTSFLTRLLYHQDMASALLDDEDLNVIRVNWGRGARTAYHQATANIRMVDLFVRDGILSVADYNSTRVGVVVVVVVVVVVRIFIMG